MRVSVIKLEECGLYADIPILSDPHQRSFEKFIENLYARFIEKFAIAYSIRTRNAWLSTCRIHDDDV